MGRPKKQKAEEILDDVVYGSGNVYADMRYKNPDDMRIKARLAILINLVIEQKRLTQAKRPSSWALINPKSLQSSTDAFVTSPLSG
jgi:predicted XRE-type DNA-binding protein